MEFNMKKTRIAFIGVGNMVQNVWLPILEKNYCEIVAFIDPNISALIHLKTLYPNVQFYNQLESKALKDVDIAFVCSPNVYHVSHTLFCLQNNVHVVIEKPACFSRNEAKKIINASVCAGKRFWISSASTERSDVKLFELLIDEHGLKDVACIELIWRRANGIPKMGSWFTDQQSAIGGCGADLGWHVLDVGLKFLGYPNIKNANCTKSNHQADLPNKEADWYKNENENQIYENVITVESQMYANFLTDNNCTVRLSTAWESHQEFDSTHIRLFATGGELNLDCTFGFSPHGIKTQLKLLQNGNQKKFLTKKEDKIAPYEKFIDRIFIEHASVEQQTHQQLENNKILSLGSAMEALYN